MNKSKIFHHQIENRNLSLYEWRGIVPFPFNELILSWNALRPNEGQFCFYVSVKVGSKWSDWLPYAVWGLNTQHGGKGHCSKTGLKVDQDIAELQEGYASEFRVKVVAEEGAYLTCISSLHVCLSDIKNFSVKSDLICPENISIDVPTASQMLLNHPRGEHMCSATSTTAVLSYLTSRKIDIIDFALKAYDDEHDIFGNWVLNTAQASTCLEGKWKCWVQRLEGFEDIVSQLRKNIPVVVSVRGPLPGSAKEYIQGHLIVVKGYDAENRKVLCMDPAFGSAPATNVAYHLDDFVDAWGRRKNIAYLFCRNLV